MPSVKDSLFGMLAVRSGYATEAQVQECIDLQEEYRRRGGKVPRLGEILAQKKYMSPEQVSAVLEGQHREKGGLFGEIAVRWKFVTREQLEECLRQQQEEHAQGIPRRKIGEIMLYKGFLQVHQIAAVLEAQKRRVIQCSGCGKFLNIAGFRPGDKHKCAACNVITQVPAIPGFSFADFRPQEAEVVPADTREAAEKQAAGGSGFREPAETAEAEKPVSPAEKAPLEIGGYEVIARLGQDATGTTVRARHIASDTVVILKIMKVTPMQDEAFLRRFIEEGKKGTQLIHKFIKRIYEVGLDKGRYYYSTEYVEGKSLKKFLDDNKRFTALEAVDLIMKVGQAISYAHKNGVVHGDLRPSSIILSDDGGVKVSDIGIAKDIAGNLRYFAKSSQVIPFYVAPELVVDESSLGQASDVYSLGAILYHLVCGKPPFEGENPLEVLMRISEGSAPSPYRLGVATEGLSKVIMKMIAPEPDERYSSVDDALADLREHLRDAALSTTKAKRTEAGQKIAARRTTGYHAGVEGQQAMRTITSTMKKQKSSAAVWIVVILVLLVIGGGFGYVYYRENIGLSWKDAFAPAPPPAVAHPGLPDIPVAPDKLAYKEAEIYANTHPDDPRGAYERFMTFVQRYPDSPDMLFGKREATRYKNLAAGKHLGELQTIRDEYLAKDDFEGALAVIDRWLEEYSDTPRRSEGIRARDNILNEEQNFLARKRSEGRIAAQNQDPSVIDAIKKYRPTKVMAVRKDEVIAELEKLLAQASQPVEQPQPDQPVTPVETPKDVPADVPALTPVAEGPTPEDEVRDLSARVGKAASDFDAKALEEISFVRVKSAEAAFIPLEAARLATFLDVILGRAAKDAKGLTVMYSGARRTITSADKTCLVVTVTVGATRSDIQVPWAQVPVETLWEIFGALIKDSKDEKDVLVDMGLYFFYRGQPGHARLAWTRALSAGADVKPLVDRLSGVLPTKEPPPTPSPVPQPSPPDKPSTPSTIVPRRILFEGDGVKNYLQNAKGVWQTGPKSMVVSGTSTAELPTGDVKGFQAVFTTREPTVKVLFSLGPWRIGIDGVEGQAIVRRSDMKEIRVPETVAGGSQYRLAVEITDRTTIFTVNGRIIEKDDNRKTQPGPLVIEVEGKLGIDLTEIRFAE